MKAHVNGARLYYETLGGDAAPPILTLHGGPGISDHRKAKRAFEPLTDAYRLVVYDHRGCGASELVGPYTNAQFAADAVGLLDHLGIDEAVFIGGSYGGFITQEAAIQYPDRVAGMVLRDTAASHEYEAAAREEARERWPAMQAADLDVPEITWAEFERVMDGDVHSDAEFERIFHGMAPLYAPSIDAFDADAAREATAARQFHHETHNAVFSDVYPQMDYTDALPDVDVPALVTVGRHDWITPPEASEELAALLPDARLTVFEESGHSPNLDQQDDYLARVRAFLDEIGY